MATETKPYKDVLLTKFLKNSERLNVAEREISRLKNNMAEMQTYITQLKQEKAEEKAQANKRRERYQLLRITILGWFCFIGLIINAFKQPLFTALHVN